MRARMTWGITVLLGAWSWDMAHADDDVAGGDGDGKDADPVPEVIVVGAFVPRHKSEVHGAVTVLDAEMLDVKRHRFVADALKFVPGLSVTEEGGIGQGIQVRMRGAEANHTLVLIDGIEVNDPAFGSQFDFANLPAGDIERAEVLRGPRSTRHGSDAIGGVINLVSVTPEAGWLGRAAASGGSFGTHRLSAAASYGDESFYGGINTALSHADGISVSPLGSEKDGYDSSSLFGRAGFIGDGMRIGGVLRTSSRKIELDEQDFDYPPTSTRGMVIDSDDRSEQRASYGRINAEFYPARGDAAWGWRHTVGAALTNTRSEFFLGIRVRPGGFRARRNQFTYDATLMNRNQAITFALEHERIFYGENPASGKLGHRSQQSSAVLDYRLGLGVASLSASLRRDLNSNFDNAMAYRLGGAASALGAKFFAAVGTGITNPGFFELYGFIPGLFRGNPDLHPEHSLGFDLGVEFSWFDDRVRGGAAWFTADLADEIKTVPEDGYLFRSTTVNARGSSKRSGIELTGQGAWGTGTPDGARRWTLVGAYAYLEAEDDEGLRELRRPRHAANLTLDFRAARGGAYLAARYAGVREDLEFIDATPEDRVELKAYMLIDLGASFDWMPGMELFARVANITDERYQDSFGYALPGRAVYAGVRLSGKAPAL